MIIPDILTIEIHRALDAGKYAKNPINPTAPRVWNLGMMLHAIAVSQGLNIDPNGKPRKPEPYVEYEDGDKVYDRYGQGQAGIEYKQIDGEMTPCVGFLYDVLTPKFGVNPSTGENSDLLTGGMLGCASRMQYLDALKRDFGKTLGADQSVGVVPSADGRYATYEGLADLHAEGLYMQSYQTLLGMKSFINSQKGVGMLQELFQVMGAAIEPRYFELDIQGNTTHGIYSGLAQGSPSAFDLLLLIALQLSYLMPQTASLPSPAGAPDTNTTTGV
ncbi:MAG: hypothetical protein VKL42_12560 [Snowella sp.]|nr:hypothetical protein [Snowella sp.]